jgi:hypothetical protein
MCVETGKGSGYDNRFVVLDEEHYTARRIVMKNKPHENIGTVRRHGPLSGILILCVILGAAFLMNLTTGDLGHSAGDAATNTAEEIDLAEVNKFEAGAFENPRNCAGCHRGIFTAWSQSMHRFAWANEFYQPDYLQASGETGGVTDIFCGECHTPTGVRTGQLPPPDGSLMDDTSLQGVSCDYCHTVHEVVETVNVRTISEPGNVKRGPRGRRPVPVPRSTVFRDPYQRGFLRCLP